MRKILVILGLVTLTIFLLLNSNIVNAQGMMGTQTTSLTEDSMQVESIETVLREILGQQKVSTIQQLDFSKISDDEWEKLGDAVMESQHPGQAHEIMDQMMGGEGSASLHKIHINMGKAYLGYGGGMMGNWNTNSSTRGGGFPMMGFGSMMGYGGNAEVYGILGSVTWIALMVFLAAGTYFFIKQAGKK